jgi:hypothetical protein
MTLEFPPQIAHSAEELDGVLAAHAEHLKVDRIDVIEDMGEARDWASRNTAPGDRDAR